MPTKRLTDLFVRAAKALSDQKQSDYFDADCRGLVLRVAASGRKLWVVRYRQGDAQRRMTLGPAGEGGLPLAEAREKARTIREKVDAGADPTAEDARALTLRGLVDRYGAREGGKKRTWKEERRILDKDALPRLGDKPVGMVRKADVLACMEVASERGADRMADRIGRILSAIMNWAVDEAIIEINPLFRLRRRAENKARKRVLTDGELRQMLSNLERIYPEDEQRRLAIRLVLLTAVRKQEAMEARRSEFDLEKGEWLIPAERVKNGKPHLLPLVPEAATVVRRAMEIAGESDLLFPSPLTGEVFAPDVLNRGLMRAFRKGRVKLKDGSLRSVPRDPILTTEKPGDATYNIHDLRRTVGSRLKEMGFSHDVREAILNHTPQDVTDKHYGHADMLGLMRKALEAWAARLEEIESGRTAASNVVAMRRAAV